MASVQEHQRHFREEEPLKIQWVALLVLYAMVIQIVLPFAQALAVDSSQGLQYQIICTANGIKQIPLNGEEAPDTADKLPNNTCPLCSLQAGVLFLGPQNVDYIEHLAQSHERPIHLGQQTAQKPVWQGKAHPSRAPPFYI